MARGRYELTARDRRRRAAWLAVLAVLIVAGTTAAGWRGNHRPGGAASAAGSAPVTGPMVAGSASVPGLVTGRMMTGRTSPITPARQLAARPAASPVSAPAASPVSAPAASRSCPPAASACVDLAAHLTWLQSDGTITYGPVRMEPGPPGTSHATPRGTFHVEWKAGAHFMSSAYHEPMPYAVFFAPGGVAFHGGPLGTASHGCVHLDIVSARYYHDHLPVGAEVVVF